MKAFVVCGSFLSIRQARPCVSARCLPSFKNGIALTLRLPKFTVSGINATPKPPSTVLSELRAFQARRQADSEAGPGLGDQLRHQG